MPPINTQTAQLQTLVKQTVLDLFQEVIAVQIGD